MTSPDRLSGSYTFVAPPRLLSLDGQRCADCKLHRQDSRTADISQSRAFSEPVSLACRLVGPFHRMQSCRGFKSKLAM